MVNISKLQCEGMTNPMGIDLQAPRLTWILCSEERNIKQLGYRVIVSRSEDSIRNGVGDFYDSDRVETDDNACIVGCKLNESGARYYWAVMVWDQDDQASGWSDIAWWEMGLIKPEDWENAKWIEPDQKPELETMETSPTIEMFDGPADDEEMVPCLLMRKEFLVEKPVASARAYTTAHGVYRMELNGDRVGNYELSPEATSYDKYLQYQTYDITDMIINGANAIGIEVAPGWWAGIIGLLSASCQYGNKMAALLKIVIKYADGTMGEIVSDESFKAAESPRRYAEISVGEKYDPQYEQYGWSVPGFDDSGWKDVNCTEYDKSVLRGQNAQHIVIKNEVPAARIFTTPAGETMVDFGQVMAGKAHIELMGKKGTTVHFYHTEEMGADGNYCRNTAGRYNNSTDTYILRGDGSDVYEPRFVYHGFRYIKVVGDVELELNKIKALVMSSDMESAMEFTCSDKRLERLHKNIVWTANANFMSIPTDNPDRERAGWTGDSHVFSGTACYLLDMKAFWRRWLTEMTLEQYEDGQISQVIPNWRQYIALKFMMQQSASSGWGDTCIILPWVLYCRYGDKRILEDNYEMMTKWIAYIRKTAENQNPDDIGPLTPEREERLKYIWNTGFHYGDWLSPSDCMDENGNFIFEPELLPLINFMPSCYYAYSTELMGKIARELGKDDDAVCYNSLSRKVKDACSVELFNENGMTIEDKQGAQVFALFTDIIPNGKRQRVLDRLIEKIDENGGCLDTGSPSTAYLLDVLSENGALKKAYDLLFCNKFPSWLYQVEKGATALWEAWQGIMEDGTVYPISYIQYAFGSVGNWIYRTIAGIREGTPGFRTVIICPELDDRLTCVDAKYASVQGDICSKWTRKDISMTVEVKIPTNTTAEVYLPGAKIEQVYESGNQIVLGNGILGFEQQNDKGFVQTGSGYYKFTYAL